MNRLGLNSHSRSYHFPLSISHLNAFLTLIYFRQNLAFIYFFSQYIYFIYFIYFEILKVLGPTGTTVYREQINHSFTTSASCIKSNLQHMAVGATNGSCSQCRMKCGQLLLLCWCQLKQKFRMDSLEINFRGPSSRH